MGVKIRDAAFLSAEKQSGQAMKGRKRDLKSSFTKFPFHGFTSELFPRAFCQTIIELPFFKPIFLYPESVNMNAGTSENAGVHRGLRFSCRQCRVNFAGIGGNISGLACKVAKFHERKHSLDPSFETPRTTGDSLIFPLDTV
jgi:hypothetical protein